MSVKTIGLMSVALLLALAGCKNQTQQTASNPSPHVVEAAAPPTPVAPVAESTASTQQPLPSTSAAEETGEPADEEAVKAEALKHFLSLPDPKPPVALEKIEGEWWADDEVMSHKIFAFVEEGDFLHGPYRFSLSLTNGTKLTVSCMHKFWVNSHPRNPDFLHCNALPVMHWTRLAATDVVTNPDADSWGVGYKNGEAFSYYIVDNICYSDGSCRSLKEASQRFLKKQREKARRGEN